MKKNIKSFMQSLRENKDGLLSGGFGSIKGGFSGITALLSTNYSCENETCSGTNNTGCSNTVDCSKSTNKQNCTNNATVTCFI